MSGGTGRFRIMRRSTGTTDPQIRALREVRRRKRLAVIPALFTLGNGICGFAAIVQVASLQFDPVTKTILNPEHIEHAGFLILLAMLFDMLDGRIARMTKTAGNFGGELDSLCDAVTFGVAPGLIVAMANSSVIASPFFWKIGWLFGIALMCGAVLRLARFNVENTHDEEAHLSFKGLPSPAAGGVIATLALLQGSLLELRQGKEPLLVDAVVELTSLHAPWVSSAISGALPFVALLVGYLMVSTVRYVHLPNRYLRGRKSVRRIAQIVFFAIIVLALLPKVGLALGFFGFALSGPIGQLVRSMRGGPRPEMLPAVVGTSAMTVMPGAAPVAESRSAPSTAGTPLVTPPPPPPPTQIERPPASPPAPSSSI